MTEKPDSASGAMDEKNIHVLHQENKPSDLTLAEKIQARYETLQGLSKSEMDALNRQVRRKLDWRLMPCITLMFLMNYLDRINVSNARLAGLQEDLHMSDTVWNTGISTFYVGYLVGQLPGNLWLAKSNPGKVLPTMALAWSVATILTSSWYNKEENPTRMAIWHAGNTISNIISGFLAAGILMNMENTLGLHSWQWMFIIEGGASILVALSGFLLLPDWPHNTKWLSEQEKEMAQYRMRLSNGDQDESQGGTWAGVKDAVRDPFTWYFCGMHFALITAQSFKDFLPSIIETFGFDTLKTYLVQAPPYAIAYGVACLLAWTSGRMQESCWHIVVPIGLSAVGTAVLISSLNVGARYFGIILLISGTYSGLNLQLSWETTLVPAPRSKKAALIAIANCISQTSHWFSPYFFPTSQEPYYRLGGGLILFGCFATAVLSFLIKLRAKRLNRLLDEAEGWSEHSEGERGWRFSY
ncbi:putative transporter [Lasiodiplodia theobromae]|uniref:Putative transporter n=1 Tax=Lasiodiplodia theobromae TaxID=45133 RepID=A0A5N5D709_9PEZI|nr:putative transporter [Lasiodiplodia theobromae]